MKFLPYEKYTIHTSKSKEEIVDELEYITSEGPVFLFSIFKEVHQDKWTFFRGNIRSNSFQITKVGIEGNSFFPIITGTIDDCGDERQVNIIMRTSKYASYMVIGMTAFAMLMLIFNIIFFDKNHDSGMFYIMDVIFIIYPYLLITLGFRAPAKSCKQKLDEIIGD